MKIGFLIENFYPIRGGAEDNCFYLAKELAKKHQVYIFTSKLKNTKDHEVLNKVNINRYRVLFRYRYYLSLTPGLLKAVINSDLDILHVHSLGFLYHDIIVLLKKSKKTKLFNTPHGPFMALNSYSIYLKFMKNLIENIEKPINNLYDKIIQVNPYQYKWMTKIGIKKDKIAFIPNGINEDTFKKTKKRSKFESKLKGKVVISYIGRIDKYKGLDQVIKILPELKNLFFIAIGQDSGDRKRLELLARKLDVKDRVIFTGILSENEKLRILDLSKIFIMPSEWEAFGISILEAMAHGNIIISTKTEGGKFLVKEYKNGFLYDFNNIKQLKQKINLILKNKPIQDKIKTNNIRKAKQFLWKNIAKDLEKLYLSSI